MRLLLVNREREDSLPLTWRALQQHVVDCSDPTTLVVWERNRVHLFAPERGRGIKNWRARNEVRLKHKVNSCCAKDEKSGGKVGGRNNECGLMQWCLEMNEDWGKGRDWTWLDEKITIELTWVSAWAASAAKRRIRREFRPGGNLARFWPPKPPTSILQILSQHIPPPSPLLSQLLSPPPFQLLLGQYALSAWKCHRKEAAIFSPGVV